jgi:hypothetical protein
VAKNKEKVFKELSRKRWRQGESGRAIGVRAALLSQLSGCSPPAVAMLFPDAWLATQERISALLVAVGGRPNFALPRR